MNDQSQSASFEFEPERFFETFVGVGRELIMRPRQFFRQLPRAGSLKNPASFLAICAFLTALLVANAFGADYRLFLLLWTAGIASSFFHSIILHLFAAKALGSGAPFSVTLRLVAYASLTDVVSWIPVIGFLPKLYCLYLIYLGLQEQHRLSHRQSVLAIIVMIGVLSALALCLVLAAPESVSQALKMLAPEQAGTGP